MKEISSLMGYRESVRVVDATLRDGGLVNDFFFTDEFVKDLYKANIEAGVDCMEMGYKASKKLFDPKKFGKWKFTNDEDIVELLGSDIVGNGQKKIKLAAMADVGRCDFKESNYGEMIKSLNKIKRMNDNITIYPGHGEFTTLLNEKKYNIYLQLGQRIFYRTGRRHKGCTGHAGKISCRHNLYCRQLWFDLSRADGPHC